MIKIHKFELDGKNYLLDINSGAVHIVDKLVYDVLNDDEKIEPLESVLERLKDKYSKDEIKEAYGEIEELIKEELLFTEDAYKDAVLREKESTDYIKALCLNIAHDCNLRCKYCFADEGEYRGKRELMSAETGKKAIDFVMKNSGPRRNIEVDLFGGEPMLCFDVVKEIISYARQEEKKYNKNVRFTMTTNATMLDEEKMEYIDKNLGNIVLSIDGRKEVNDKVRVYSNGKGSYDKILPNIKRMVQIRDKHKQYYVRGTFTKNNIDFYNDVMHFADLGFKEISVEPVVLPDSNPLHLSEEDLPKIFEQYELLYKEMERRKGTDKEFKFYHFNIDINGGPCIYKRISGCGAGHEYVAITPSGDIYPCHQFVGDKRFIMGNLNTGITNHEMQKTFKDANVYSKPECQNCWAKFYCSGGCQANNFNFNNDIHKPYKLGCKMQRKRIECAIALKSKK